MSNKICMSIFIVASLIKLPTLGSLIIWGHISGNSPNLKRVLKNLFFVYINELCTLTYNKKFFCWQKQKRVLQNKKTLFLKQWFLNLSQKQYFLKSAVSEASRLLRLQFNLWQGLALFMKITKLFTLMPSSSSCGFGSFLSPNGLRGIKLEFTSNSGWWK